MPAGSSRWLLAMHRRNLFSVFAWCSLSRGLQGLCPTKGMGPEGDAFASCCLSCSNATGLIPGTSLSFPMLATQNQAISRSSLVPHCVSIFAWPFGIKLEVNLKEKMALRVG